MAKKQSMTVKKQARRQRALERFSIDPERAKADKGYAERKAIELEALKRGTRNGNQKG